MDARNVRSNAMSCYSSLFTDLTGKVDIGLSNLCHLESGHSLSIQSRY